MIYTPNMAVVMPATGNWDGNTEVERAAAHPALLFVPDRRETVEGDFFRGVPIPGSLLNPPVSAVNVMYAADWRVEINIAGPGGALNEIADIATDAATWGSVLKDGHNLVIDVGDDPSGEEDFTRVQLALRSWRIAYIWGNPEPDQSGWWPGLECLVSSTKRARFDPPSPLVSVQATVSPAAGHDETSIVIDLAGDAFSLYYAGSDQSGLSGTIKLTPIEWLTVV